MRSTARPTARRSRTRRAPRSPARRTPSPARGGRGRGARHSGRPRTRSRAQATAVTIASVASAGISTATGSSANRATPRTSRRRLTLWTLRQRNATWAKQVDREAADQRERGNDLQRVVDVLDRLLQPERDEHDPGDHRQVQVRVGVAGDLVLLAPVGDARQPPRRDQRDDVEVRPPHRRGERDAEDRGGHDPSGDIAGDAGADRHDRLAQRDDDDQAVPLGEVLGNELPARRRPKKYGPPSRARWRAPRARPARAPSRNEATREQPDADRRAHPEDRHRAAQVAGRRGWRARTARCARPGPRRRRTANRRPRSSKASGTQSATTRNAAIAAKITSRTAPSSGSMTLVSQA